ncbi:MAG: CYTH domain-containing protein [Methylococcaceae bacterium]|nr:CYTH domain-containing protein [Methylococcaceae bacterium]MCI0667116.1 CYTH domain-containing protein [Methylococcaceae bacterium]MCI0734610.1 CYTH domain-containing protein [Methylococcaceae bacterium]
MGIEIERKFLVRDDGWRRAVIKSSRMRQGYLSQSGNASVRVRSDAERGWINIKSVTLGVQRQEFEYEIPRSDAEQILDTLAGQPLIEKIRHFAEIGSHTWEIDEFEGQNAGLIVAEIELSEAGEAFDRPAWIGTEVTRDARYYNTNLARKPYTTWQAAIADQPPGQ